MRPASKFVGLANSFRSEVRVSYRGTQANGRSILDMTTLAAECGTTLDLEARGPDAEAALDALAELVAAGFHMTGEAFVDSSFLTATQYWLRLERGEPILHRVDRGFRAGDMLLFETSRKRFPAEDGFLRDLCVVKNPRGGEPAYVLGHVMSYPAGDDPDGYIGPAYLGAYVFDGELPEKEMGKRIIVDLLPNGELKCTKLAIRVARAGRGPKFVKPVIDPRWIDDEPKVAYGDIVGVWTGILHRRPGPP